MTKREEFIDALEKAKTIRENYKTCTVMMSFEFVDVLIELLKEQEVGLSSLETTTIVRCKDCKHGGCRTHRASDGSVYRVVCKKHGTKKNEVWMDADWFCADGERK